MKAQPSTRPTSRGRTSGLNRSMSIWSCCPTTSLCISGSWFRGPSRVRHCLFSHFSAPSLSSVSRACVLREMVCVIAAVLTATSTLLVEKSLNARPYELTTFLVVLCAVCLFKWLERSAAGWLWAFSILALLATAMQLFSLLAPGLDALLCRRGTPGAHC